VLLVLGAFTTISEAAQATRVVLETGYPAGRATAYGKAGAGRLLLAGKVALRPVGDPARLVTRSERLSLAAISGALVGLLFAGIVLAVTSVAGMEPVRLARPWLQDSAAIALVIAASATLGGALGALARGSGGLPQNLAFSYGMRLEQGDTVLVFPVAHRREAQATLELLTLQGAALAHVTSGTVEPVEPVESSHER
jgi:hypothetical protein